MSLRRDLEQFLADLSAAGYKCKRGRRSGHWKIYDGGVLVTGAPATPSEYRGLRNLKGSIKRHERRSTTGNTSRWIKEKKSE